MCQLHYGLPESLHVAFCKVRNLQQDIFRSPFCDCKGQPSAKRASFPRHSGIITLTCLLVSKVSTGSAFNLTAVKLLAHTSPTETPAGELNFMLVFACKKHALQHS